MMQHGPLPPIPNSSTPKPNNARTGFILLAVALTFFVGIVLRKWLEPSLLALLAG
jgi:hypothetical protein